MSKLLKIENLYHENTEAEIDQLNQKGQYPVAYHKCELILIEWADGIEWFNDNKWYKDDVDKLESEDTLIDMNLKGKDKGKGKLIEDKKKPSLRLMDLFSVAAYYTNNFYRAFHIQYKLLNSSYTNELSNMDRLKSNIHFSIDKIKDRLDFFPQDIILKLNNPERKKRKLVTLTMTTCKRFDLFERTFNSFLNACKDIELIDRFLIIDDNSSEEDRHKMEHMYPFVEMVKKNEDNKGHPISMNMIKDMVETPYCLHLEDDHEFFCHRNYIKPSMRIMLENDDIRQVLFNENYGEIPSDLPNIGGGEIMKTKSGKKFRVHVHYPMGTPEYDQYMATLGRQSNTHWPHFSFRPSLFRTDIWKLIGEYQMEREFERSYANRYVANGFRSAFLIGLHHIHIGRTSHDLKAGKNVDNAYTLNDTRQWGY